MPGDRQAFSAAINAADRYRWDGRWQEAAKEYQQALAEFPDAPEARSGLGFCYMQTKQWQKALNEYEYTLRHDPGNVIALSKTAELYGILNRRSDAYQAYLHLADLYSQAGQGTRAEAAWQKTVQLSPGDPAPHEKLASYYFERKDIALMIQERLAAARGYLLHDEPGLARVQCEEVLYADELNEQAQQLLSQILAKQTSGTLQPVTGYDLSFPSETDVAGSAVQPADSGPLAATDNPAAGTGRAGNTTGNSSGGNTSIMGNMGSAGNFGGVGNSGPYLAMAGTGGGAGNAGPASHKRITASQVTGALRQAQTFQTQGRFNDAIDLCEQILQSGFDRPDARYFLGWLYQEQQRWDDAINQFQMLLNDPDYALSCYYALGQCYRARGDLRTATVHFDEAVDRVNLDALTVEESDQLVQLCQEAAEAHRQMGEQEQALTVYNALLGFLRSRGWSDKVAQVEFMLQQAQNSPPSPMPRSATPPQGATRSQPLEQIAQQPPIAPQQPQVSEAPTMAFNISGLPSAQAVPPVASVPPAPAAPPVQTPASQPSQSGTNSSVGELPDWLTGILSDADKTQLANKSSAPAQPAQTAPPVQPAPPAQAAKPAQSVPPPPPPTAPTSQPVPVVSNNGSHAPVTKTPMTSSTWLTDDVKPAEAARSVSPVPPGPAAEPVAPMPAPVPMPAPAPIAPPPVAPAAPTTPPPPVNKAAPDIPVIPTNIVPEPVAPVIPAASGPRREGEDLLAQMAGAGSDTELKHVAEAVLASTATLPESTRLQVIRSMQDIQKYIEHGLLTPATEECLRVIDMAPQYLDVHQVLCEIYVRQGKLDQAVTKYAILVDTYVVNGRIDDAISTYRRILQLEPNNLTYRARLIGLLQAQGNKEDLLRERTLAAESYLRLGYMDRALTELEQALQESPTSVPTRLNYALALQKLGRMQQAVAEYQRVLQVDPRNITALVRWHILMVTVLRTPRSASLEVLSRIRWQLRGEGLKNYAIVVREYTQVAENYPNNADVYFALGQVYQQAGQFDNALDAYNQAMRDNAVEVLARANAAQCLLSQGKPEAAIQQLEQALQLVRRSPKSIDPMVWAARPREDGDEHQAPEVELSTTLARAYGRTGRQEQMQAILRQLKQSKPAEDEISSVIAEISSRQVDTEGALQEYMDLVRHYLKNRQGDNAFNVLKEVVRMAPEDPRAHTDLAELYVTRGLLEEGIAELRVLADIHLRRNEREHAGTAIQRIGNIYAEIGNNEEALINLRRAVDLNPHSLELLREVVGFCLQLGRGQDAAQYQVIIARHYYETHQVKESVAALQQLITIDHGNYEAYDMLGQTYQSVGEYEQASRVYRNLAKVNPDSPLAKERLATLQDLRG